jgi:hypothetical protein
MHQKIMDAREDQQSTSQDRALLTLNRKHFVRGSCGSFLPGKIRVGGPAQGNIAVSVRRCARSRRNGYPRGEDHPDPAHTDGDSIIYFSHANVMHVGAVPSSLRYPNQHIESICDLDRPRKFLRRFQSLLTRACQMSFFSSYLQNSRQLRESHKLISAIRVIGGLFLEV